MATLKDIAAESGLSIGAVSRILNQDASLGVPPETRQRVFDTARRLGYRKTARKKKKKAAKAKAEEETAQPQTAGEAQEPEAGTQAQVPAQA
jgi:transcriptional regulator with XRE-family HTH domain